MPQDRITRVSLKGLRTLESVDLHLRGLTVLIGANGSGKSSILEGCEILRRAASAKFVDEFLTVHGGFESLKRFGADRMTFGVRIEGVGKPIEYSFSMEDLYGIYIAEESLQIGEGADQVDVIVRNGRSARVRIDKTGNLDAISGFPGSRLLLTSYGFHVPHPAMTRTVRALEQIDVHLPFAVLPAWAARESNRSAPLRISPLHQPTDSLNRLGTNLANIFADFRKGDEREWEITLDYVRIGLGDDIVDLTTKELPAGEGISLWLRYNSFAKEVPASSLSDGTLDYLAFVALARLQSQRSLIAFDEPENGLHPHLMMRVLDLFEAIAGDRSVLLATHSDRLLDGLSDPANAVVLCDLDKQRLTRLFRPDPGRLEQWLQKYVGVGRIRDEGMLDQIVDQS